MLSLKHAVINPRFTQPIIRIIRGSSVNDYGELITVERKSTIQAVVSVPKDSDIIRWQEGSSHTKFILVTTTVKLNPENEPGNNDIIVYRNDRYQVLSVDDYSGFGYTRAVCQLMDYAVHDQNKKVSE